MDLLFSLLGNALVDLRSNPCASQRHFSPAETP